MHTDFGIYSMFEIRYISHGHLTVTSPSRKNEKEAGLDISLVRELTNQQVRM